MGIRCTRDVSQVQNLLKNLRILSEKELLVGIMSSQKEKMLMIANVHEFGAQIKAKNGKYLSIPLEKNFRHISPRQVSGLFVYRSRRGNLFLARRKGNGRLELCYWLTKEVNIPERSFIRAGFDAHRIEMERFGEQSLAQFLPMRDGISRFYDAMGNFAVGKIRTFLVDLRDPANSPLTVKLKGSSNPLVGDGHLGNHITYRMRKK